MESEDEDTDKTWFSPPYMRLFEEDENQLRALQCDDPRMDPRFYVVLRFFRTIEGFHEGSLDLTGRHLHRYETVIQRFYRFLSDMLCLGVHATQYEETENDWKGNPRVYVNHSFTDEKPWTDFATKWCIPTDFGYSWLLAMTQDCLSCLSENPTPKIQKTCLVDLPVELIEIIMHYASIEQARLLSATCSYLRRIGLRFIFVSRDIRLDANPDWKMLRSEPDADHYEHLCAAALTSRRQFLDATGFLLSRPNLIDSLRTMFLRDEWTQRALYRTLAESFEIHSLPDFYNPVYRDLCKIMEAAKNLTTLSISGFDICPELLQAISHVETLHTIRFSSCQLDEATCDCIIQNEVHLQDAVLNLLLSVHGEDSIWYTPSLYPQLRTLTVMGSVANTESLPADILERATPFKTLERFSLDAFDPDAVSLLSAWMMQALDLSAVNPELKLTHFKVHTRVGLPDFVLIDLMNTLRFSPNLQILVLEGLALTDLGPGIIDLIAEACPSLLGLTLVRRHNERQRETKLAAWPHTSGEYASRFVAFSRLRFFSWNFPFARLSPTPAIMSQFENGFPDIKTKKGRDERKEMNEIAYFDDMHLMAASFAVQCPTLKTFAIEGRTPHFVCQIDRSVDGRIELSNLHMNEMHRTCEMWNTELFQGWPLVNEL